MRISVQGSVLVASAALIAILVMAYFLKSSRQVDSRVGDGATRNATEAGSAAVSISKDDLAGNLSVLGSRKFVRPPVIAGGNRNLAVPGTAKDEQSELKKMLDEILPYDRENFARFDLPREDLDRATSAQLSRHFADSPMYAVFGLYDNVNVGIYRVAQASATIQELLARDDMVDGIVEYYQEANQEIMSRQSESLPRHDRPLSNGLMALDELLMYPDIFERTRGHERRILKVLKERYEAMTAANARHIQLTGEELYSVSLGTTKALSVKLLERIDPGGYELWKTGVPIAEEGDFFRYLSEQIAAQ